MAAAARTTLDAIRRAARPADDLDAIVAAIGDAHLVCLGEATHGTHAFYDLRARITQRLIRGKRFNAVAVEADFPDAYRVNRYVRGRGSDASAEQALGDFTRFPRWMWRNTVTRDFADWLAGHNRSQPPSHQVSFVGMDLYSLHRSIDAVVGYLDEVDPPAARRARRRYGCFDHFDDPQGYGYAVSMGWSRPCEEAVIQQLVDMAGHTRQDLTRAGLLAEDERFYARHNAQVVRNAERYYRRMFAQPAGGADLAGQRVSTWNLRDSHMADTLDALRRHLSRTGRPARIVVWAHNSHLGDARATSMGDAGEHNVGQLVRQRHGMHAYLLGFTTYRGTVTAADDWDAPAGSRTVQPALPGSIEALFHEAGLDQHWLDLRSQRLAGALREPRLQRAIGVIYRPQSERQSHYFHGRLADQFDAVIHIDTSHALRPLDAEQGARRGAADETYPSGL